jgi:hypothetical protein
MSRSPVPSTITDPEHQSFLDDLWKRRIAAQTALDASPTNAELATAINALIAAMQSSGAMES